MEKSSEKINKNIKCEEKLEKWDLLGLEKKYGVGSFIYVKGCL